MDSQATVDVENHDDPLAGPTYIVGFVGIVIFLCTGWLVVILEYDTAEYMEERVNQSDGLELVTVREEQMEQLESDGWHPLEEERVSRPIGEGIQAVLEEYGEGGQ